MPKRKLVPCVCCICKLRESFKVAFLKEAFDDRAAFPLIFFNAAKLRFHRLAATDVPSHARPELPVIALSDYGL